jgi:hypothetical protein
VPKEESSNELQPPPAARNSLLRVRSATVALGDSSRPQKKSHLDSPVISSESPNLATGTSNNVLHTVLEIEPSASAVSEEKSARIAVGTSTLNGKVSKPALSVSGVVCPSSSSSLTTG